MGVRLPAAGSDASCKGTGLQNVAVRSPAHFIDSNGCHIVHAADLRVDLQILAIRDHEVVLLVDDSSIFHILNLPGPIHVLRK